MGSFWSRPWLIQLTQWYYVISEWVSTYARYDRGIWDLKIWINLIPLTYSIIRDPIKRCPLYFCLSFVFENICPRRLYLLVLTVSNNVFFTEIRSPYITSLNTPMSILSLLISTTGDFYLVLIIFSNLFFTENRWSLASVTAPTWRACQLGRWGSTTVTPSSPTETTPLGLSFHLLESHFRFKRRKRHFRFKRRKRRFRFKRRLCRRSRLRARLRHRRKLRRVEKRIRRPLFW